MNLNINKDINNDLISIINKYNKVLIISSSDYQEKLIEYYSNISSLRNITYKTKEQVFNDLLGSYLKEARIKLVNNNNLTPELAEIKLKNTFLIPDNLMTDSSKLQELAIIKRDYQKYFLKHELITNMYINTKIIIVNDFNTSDEFKITTDILKKINPNIEYIEVYKSISTELDIYEFKNYKDEVLSTLNKIAMLIESKVSPSKIKIQIPEDYMNYAVEVFNHADIALNISEKNSLLDYEITKTIVRKLQEYLDLKVVDAFKKVLDNYKNTINPVLDKIVNVFNSYLKYDHSLDYIYDDLIYSLMNTSYMIKYTGGIRVCNITETVIGNDDYVFVLGLNQDVYPRIFKDEEYLLDYERKELGLLLSSNKNMIVVDKIKKTFNNINNLILSYSSTLPISSIVSKLERKINIIKKTNDLLISYSKKNDEIALGKHLDLFYKYDQTSEDLYTLYNMYPNNQYRKYDNSFTGVSFEILEKYLKDGITLSYTAIDKYNKCGFLFYLENVLKIRRTTNEESIFIGNLIHHLLYLVLQEEEISNLRKYMEIAVKDYCLEEEIKLASKDEFFINQYIDTLIYLLDFIKLHQKSTEFRIFGLEKEFSLLLDFEIPVSLKGKIDKILTLEVNDTKFAVVVDYKSGNTDFDLNRVVYGLNMQIMFYFYFLNKTYNSEFEFAGGYLQGVMPNNTFSNDPKKTYLEQLYDYFKLQGYSTTNRYILQKIDKDIEVESKFIKGIRFTNNGDFYSYSKSKVIDSDKFKKLLTLTEENINKTTRKIIDGDFRINPKLIGNSFDSCQFCSYKDICFRDSWDYENLKEFKEFEFLEDKDDSN